MRTGVESWGMTSLDPSLLVFGMWLGRRDWRGRAPNRRIILIAASVVLLAELTSHILIFHFAAHPNGMDAETIEALLGTESMPPLPLFLMSSGGTVVVLIALSVRAAEMRPLRPWLQPLAAAGQMALTWYVLHIVLGLGTVVVSGLAGREPLPVAEGCGVLFFALAVIVSWLSKRRYRRGPLEWAMRAVAG
jgi:uncharacterized protein